MGESGQLDDETSLDDASENTGTQYVRPSARATIPPRQPAATSQALPERFGRYRIERCLGRGAMGDVYLASDTQLDRPVALKIPKFTDASDSELIERFFREARAAATVRHPNLCPVYDAGDIDGIHYLSMAYIDGRPLYDVLAQNGCPPPRDAATLVLKLAKALDAAHSSGVIHRDLKPANIMIDSHGEPIVMDFGLARRLNQDDSRLTQSGFVMGSPAYMSPEQVEGDIEKMGPACDIYSLGVIFYELLAGEVPFRGSIASVMGQIITVDPKAPSAVKKGGTPDLDAICLKMIAKRPEDRFRSMREVASALEAYLTGRPTGMALADQPPTAAEPRPSGTVRHAGGGIVIAPWMLWTAVAVVVAGFGVTWQLIAHMMKQSGAGELTIDSATRQALQRDEAHVWLDGNKLTAEEVKSPIELAAGDHKIELREGGIVKATERVTSDKDDPMFLETTAEGRVRYTPLHHRVARWVLTQGGTIKLVGSDAKVASSESLPREKIRLEEIDLSAAKQLPADQLELIKRLGPSLKRLVLPKSLVSPQQIDELQKSLSAGCEIKTTG